MRSPLAVLSGVLAAVVLTGWAAAVSPPPMPAKFDWPQWQGPDRTNVSRETGLLRKWPKQGPSLLWTAKDLGGGYSTPSVAGGRVYGMGYVKDDEIVWALNAETGKEIWHRKIAAANRRVGYGEGSRCSPTVDGKHLYVLGVSGDVACLTAEDGTITWQKNLVKDFSGAVPGWGYCESPLVDGDRVVVAPGGGTATVVALDKKDGSAVWTSKVPGGDGAQYASAIAITLGGKKQYLEFLHGGVVGVAAEDGRFLWRYNAPANGTANCTTPIFHNNAVFASSNYGTGGGLTRLTAEGDSVKATEVYFTKHLKNHHGGVVLVDGFLYGANDPDMLTCLEFETGKVRWDTREPPKGSRNPGKGSVTCADGCLYYRNEGGPMFLAEATPEAYRQLGTFNPPDRSDKPAWAHPVVSNGRLYLRDQDKLLCYDVRAR